MRKAEQKPRGHGFAGYIPTAIGTVFTIILSLMLICNLVIIAKGTLDTERPPSILGVTPMVVLSGSMSGTQPGHIETGDLIFVSSIEPDALAVGDVIAYMSVQTIVTHRITAIDRSGDGSLLFTTKGDANDTVNTEAVTEAQLVGIYRARIPRVGDLALFLQQPLGMLLFVGVSLMAFIVYDILRRQRYASKERNRTRQLEYELARLRALNTEGASHSPDGGPVN